ncbi:MAG: hypothetical protein MZV64_43055 [Ignavibacteriales bacterium]|nr:hypothetical protein [Ignavibacteriales bacterium]
MPAERRAAGPTRGAPTIGFLHGAVERPALHERRARRTARSAGCAQHRRRAGARRASSQRAASLGAAAAHAPVRAAPARPSEHEHLVRQSPAPARCRGRRGAPRTPRLPLSMPLGSWRNSGRSG